MRDFIRENTLFSLCGLNCALCGLNLGGYCPGCGGGDGNQTCALARCARAHNSVEYCFDCPEYPCEKYASFANYDSFVVCRNRSADIDMARETGVAAYTGILREKREILEKLIADYNDGRRKTFYMTAVSLLSLEDLKAAVDGIEPAAEASKKERALEAVARLKERADARGVELKLHKKPKREGNV